MTHSEPMVEAASSLGRIAAEVSHAVNNPLGYLCANLDMLRQYSDELSERLKTSVPHRDLERAQLDTILAELPGVIDDSVQGLEHIAQFVTKLSSLSVLNDDTDRHWVDLTAIVRDVVDELRLVYGAVHFTVYYGPMPPLNCSPALRAALFAVIENGAEAAGGGGTVSITAGVEENSAILRVHDSGPGIAPEIVQRLFEPFASTKTGRCARGLGLTLARNAVAQHDGTLALRSNRDGTEAVVQLPLVSLATGAGVTDSHHLGYG